MVLIPVVIFLVALVLVVLAIIVLTVIEKGLNKKVIVKRKEEQTYYQRKISGVDEQKGDPNVFLTSVDEIAREFFTEKFGVDGNLKYSQLIGEFEKKGNMNAVSFCEGIQEIYYGGGSINNEKLNFLYNTLNTFIEEDAVMSKQKPKVTQNWWLNEGKIIGGNEEEEQQDSATEKIQKGNNSEMVRVKEGVNESPPSVVPVVQAKVSIIVRVKNKIKVLKDRLSSKMKERKMRKRKLINVRNTLKRSQIERVEQAKKIREEENRKQETFRNDLRKSSQEQQFEAREIQEAPLQIENVDIEKNDMPRTKEPRNQRNVRSIDDLDRLKEKIKARRKIFPFEQSYNEV
jgi:hypothetical protein